MSSNDSEEKVVLHVGCGPQAEARLHPEFRGPGWRQVSLDIDPGCAPDVVGTMTDLSMLEDGGFDAVYSSHNLEHLRAHEVPVALGEFVRVLKADGYALVGVPDLGAVAALVVAGRLAEAAYESPAGPITALDMLYGHGASIAGGNDYMAHRTGFTEETLRRSLLEAGFGAVAVGGDGGYNLWARAYMPGHGKVEEARRVRSPVDGGRLERGLAAQRSGRLEEALGHYEGLLEADPGDADALNLAGVVRYQQGDLAGAKSRIEGALSRNGENPFYHYSLGNVRLGEEDWPGAAAAYEAAVALNPDYVEAWCNLGKARHRAGDTARAVASYRRAVDLDPAGVQAARGLAEAARAEGEPAVEIEAYRRHLRARPDSLAMHNELGNALRRRRRLAEAEECFRAALALDSRRAEVHANLGSVLRAQGRLDEAVESLRRGLELKPESLHIHSNLLFCLNYVPDLEPAQLLAEHRDWARRHASPAVARAPATPPLDPGRRLRVGYLSPDFRTHPVAWFMLRVLESHDPAEVETFCYAHVAEPDAMTAALRARAHVWRDVHRATDDAAARTIREDRIDILVDLAGHSGNNRLPVLAREPAPILASYLGYPNTTGLAAVDYRITDDIADPPGAEGHYTEKLVRLAGGFTCFAPPADAPEVAPSPAAGGGVTFGSLNALSKLNDRVFDLWAVVLRSVLGSRLAIVRDTMEPATAERIRDAFSRRDVASSRLELRDRPPDAGTHLSAYAMIDIVLDTLPWNGHTTACEALWMGVPVVTLAGSRHAGRICASILHQAGLEDLVAASPDEFVRIAAGLAGDRDRLEHLRRTLRETVRGSRLCDGPAFTRSLETAYREMWAALCAS